MVLDFIIGYLKIVFGVAEAGLANGVQAVGFQLEDHSIELQSLVSKSYFCNDPFEVSNYKIGNNLYLICLDYLSFANMYDFS